MDLCALIAGKMSGSYQHYPAVIRDTVFRALGGSAYILFCSGTRLLSHIVSNVVPSAARVLTVVFGMGTGVSPGRIGTGNMCY